MAKLTATAFWRQVDKSGPRGCWLWRGSTMPNGYGRFRLDSHHTVLAHRAAFELARGPIPAGMMLLHSCDVRNCVNPDHLSVGTARDNARDAIERGRLNIWNRGVTHCKHGHAFTPENTMVGVKGNGRKYRHCRTCHNARRPKKKVGV